MRMKRIWMTGCMALVLLAAGRAPAREEQDGAGESRSQRTRITLTSRFDVDETVRQVERFARRAGLPVLAKAVPKTAHGEEQGARVLVLGDEDGRTPVVQAAADHGLELPWQVVVRQGPDGRTEVSLPAAGSGPLPDEVPMDILQKVTALPAALQSAIT